MKDIRIILKTAGIVAVLLVLQIAVVPLMGIGTVEPDLVLIGIVFIAMRYGQLPALFYAFSAGLLYDLFVGDIVGLSALAKTIGGFAAGYFHSEEKAEFAGATPRFIGATALAAAIHNQIYIIGYFKDITADIARTLLLHGAGSMLYTVILSALPVLILSRKRRTVKV